MASHTPVPAQFRAKAAGAPAPSPAPTAPPLASPEQVKYISDLLDNRNLLASPKFFDTVNAMDKDEYAQYLKDIKEGLPTLTKHAASQWITALKALPRKQTEPTATAQHKQPDVPDGRYALVFPADDLNPVRFYRVKHGKDYTDRGGKDWSHFLFVERFVSDDTFPVKGAERMRVLTEIATDPLAAAQRYGQEARRCCRCNRNLTRRLSRQLGIGPVCATKVGWMTAEMVGAKAAEITAQGYDPYEEME